MNMKSNKMVLNAYKRQTLLENLKESLYMYNVKSWTFTFFFQEIPLLYKASEGS